MLLAFGKLKSDPQTRRAPAHCCLRLLFLCQLNINSVYRDTVVIWAIMMNENFCLIRGLLEYFRKYIEDLSNNLSIELTVLKILYRKLVSINYSVYRIFLLLFYCAC